MVVCRYFLQGYCKFGDRCRFQHYQDNRSPSPVANYRNYNRSWHAATHEQPHHGRAGSPVDNSHVPLAGSASLNPLDLAEAIKEDVIAMEEGGQWPLSCYTPSKDFGCFPGFHDTSVEEVRYEAYQALASGMFDQYVKKFESLMQATRMKWAMLKNPTGQVMSVIEKMASGGGQASSGLSSFSFAASFNATSAAAAAPPQPAATFSLGGNAAFGAFSAPPPPQLPVSNFTFTLDPPAATSFPSSTPPSSVFGAAPTFAQSGGMMFGQSSASGPQQQTVPSSVMFSGEQSSGSTFGSAPAISTQFGSSASHTKAGPRQQGNTTHLALSDMSEAERQEFTAVTFTLGCIPLRPPPRELCV